MTKSPKNKAAAHRVLDAAQRALKDIDIVSAGHIVKVANAIAACRGKVVTIGVGKSGYIAQKIASTMTSLGVMAVFVHPTDALHGDLGVVSSEDAVIAFSHSGDTRELVEALRHIAALKPLIVAISGNGTSRLASISTHKIIYSFAEEGSPHDLAPMASTTTTLVIGDMLAAEVAMRRGFSQQKFAQLHPSGSLGLKLACVEDVMYIGKQIPTIRSTASFTTALEEMTQKSLGVVAATDARGRIVGIITDGDIRRFIVSGKYSPRSTVAEAMRPQAKTITPRASLYEALRIMEQHRITSLFVVNGRQVPQGLIHLHQIVERQLA